MIPRSLLRGEFIYITAITKPQIKVLLKEVVFQMSLFDERVCEVEQDGLVGHLRPWSGSKDRI